MKIWSNTKTLDGLVDDLSYTTDKSIAEVALIGGKALDLDDFPRLRGIFKCGVGRDNVPEAEAARRGIRCAFPSSSTAAIIFEETACFACHLVFKCLFADIGDFGSWRKLGRTALSEKHVLVVGTGNIGKRVAAKLEHFVSVSTFDILTNPPEELVPMIRRADCVTLHVPLNDSTRGFFDADKLDCLKDGASVVNTARAALVPEKDLMYELSSGRLRAAFDVFWTEPYEGELLKLAPDRFMTTPHVASTCNEFMTATAYDFRQFVDSLISNGGTEL